MRDSLRFGRQTRQNDGNQNSTVNVHGVFGSAAHDASQILHTPSLFSVIPMSCHLRQPAERPVLQL